MANITIKIVTEEGEPKSLKQYLKEPFAATRKTFINWGQEICEDSDSWKKRRQQTRTV